MVAIVGGLGAALSWAIATLASSRSSRQIGPMSVLGWVMAVGLVVAIVPALLSDPIELGPPELAGLFVLGVSHNAGLLLAYAALSIGRVSIVAPIVATEGAVAAVLAILLGDTLSLAVAAVLGAISVGVVLAAAERTRHDQPPDHVPHPRRAAVLAIAAACAFSVGLVLAGRLGAAGMPPAWIIVASRLVGVTFIVMPLLATRRFQLTRQALPLVVLAGILEAVGSAAYTIAASQDIAVAAVLGSLFAAIAAIGGFLLFGERLQRLQVAGVVTIAIGITVLAWLQA